MPKENKVRAKLSFVSLDGSRAYYDIQYKPPGVWFWRVYESSVVYEDVPYFFNLAKVYVRKTFPSVIVN